MDWTEAGFGYQETNVYHSHATTMRAAQALPEFFAANKYANPNNSRKCPFQLGIGADETFFEYLTNNKFVGDSFNDYMAAVHMGEKGLHTLYDFEERWGSDLQESTPLFVDVGGGNGHQCLSLVELAGGKGRIILQDLPEVTDDLSLEQV